MEESPYIRTTAHIHVKSREQCLSGQIIAIRSPKMVNFGNLCLRSEYYANYDI